MLCSLVSFMLLFMSWAVMELSIREKADLMTWQYDDRKRKMTIGERNLRGGWITKEWRSSCERKNCQVAEATEWDTKWKWAECGETFEVIFRQRKRLWKMSLGIQKDIGITMENDVAQATLKEKLDAIAFGQNPAWFNMGFLGPWGQFGSTYDQLGLTGFHCCTSSFLSGKHYCARLALLYQLVSNF